MKHFWEQSPEWQRKEQLLSALEAAEKAKEDIGRRLLILVEVNALGGELWLGLRDAYMDAVAAGEDAFAAWSAADRAFEASPVGQAQARYFKDPLASTAAESEAA